jgi:uncharacterized membrane protein YcaP (DUF421 family)
METVLRGVAIYFLLLIVLRLTGRRSLGEMTPFDFILLLIIAETTQQALLGDDFSLTNAAVLIVTMFSIDIVLSYLKRSSELVDTILDGRPTVLMLDGRLDEHAMKKSRIDKDDILESARQIHGLENLSEVKHAILEVRGDISVIPK